MLSAEIQAIPVEVAGRAPTAGAQSARGGAIGFADGEVIAWLAGDTPRRVRLGFAPTALCLSGDGCILGAVAPGGTRFVLVELPSGRVRLAIKAPNARRQPFVATIAEGKSGPIALFSRKPGELEGFEPRADLALACRLASFRVAALQPLASNRHVGLLGHFEGETKDSFTIASVEDMVTSPSALDERLKRKTGLSDYAYRLGLGPYGEDRVVGCRDPEEDEDEVDPEAGPLHGLRGVYVRGLDGKLYETLVWKGDIPAGPAICGSNGIVAWAERDAVTLAKLGSPHETASVPAKWLSCAPDGSAVLVATPDGGFGLLRWR